MIEADQGLTGRRLAPGERFQFACGPDLACFNACCRDKRLPLLPYDLLRLRRALNLPSAQILEQFAELETDPISGWPALRIRLSEDGACPFVSPAGCRVYAHRPACCRVYPLARAVRPGAAGGPPQEVFLLQDAPGCLGWSEPRELSVERWIQDQGLAEYQAANNYALRLFMHPRRTGKVALNQAQTHAFISALYNLEVFRQAAAQEGFASRWGLAPERLAQARGSEEELLRLGVDWLAGVLFGGG
ncbi:MAG: YkgJ family cysteine cluster protein [Desulfarculus sp.]|nr:MAG: YkgJ family cysteine cluster protein [Desulfarculus sp.]